MLEEFVKNLLLKTRGSLAIGKLNIGKAMETVLSTSV